MSGELPERLEGQFGPTDPARDIWRALSVVVDTDAYLNLGYSGPGQSHLVGHPQRRLVDRVGDALLAAGVGHGDRLADLGCGRGGPLERLEDTLEVEGVGIDLVAHNLHLARARDRSRYLDLVQGDFRSMPVGTDRLDAAVAIDALVYVPDVEEVFEEVGRAVRPGGTVVVTDLVVDPAGAVPEEALERFERAWGFADLRVESDLASLVDDHGFVTEGMADLTPYSLDRIEGWARRYRKLRQGPARTLVDGLVRRVGLEPEGLAARVTATASVLPSLYHRLYRLRVAE